MLRLNVAKLLLDVVRDSSEMIIFHIIAIFNIIAIFISLYPYTKIVTGRECCHVFSNKTKH